MTTCAVIVSLAAGIVLACGIDRLASRLPDAGRSLRLTAVFLVAVLPLSAVFLMPCTEALFCALAAWALVWAGRGRWLAAGFCACAAGLVRPTAVAVVVAMAVGAASTWRQGDPRRWGAAAGCALAPLGTVGFLVWAALSTGRPDAWLHAEASGWGTTFDAGAHFAGYLFLVVVHGAMGPVDVAVVGAAAACAVAIARMRRRHLPGEVVAYVVGILSWPSGRPGSGTASTGS
ncbi:MAG: hypothetical protein ACXV3A_03240 [Kineosporiaceae bacterium]